VRASRGGEVFMMRKNEGGEEGKSAYTVLCLYQLLLIS